MTLPDADSPDVLERFHAHLDLVQIIASQVSRSIHGGVDYDDLLSAGREGLLDAARRFDPARGIPFRAYANFRVRGAIVDGVRQMSALSRRAYERLAALEAATLVSEGEAMHAFPLLVGIMDEADAEEALDEHLSVVVTAAAIGMVSEAMRTEPGSSASESDPEREYEREELLALVRAGLRELPQEQGEIISRHYFKGERLEDIAKDLNMSRSWASRLHSRAISRLTRRLGSAT
jgi:RNA polymerase sigma factor FliA